MKNLLKISLIVGFLALFALSLTFSAQGSNVEKWEETYDETWTIPAENPANPCGFDIISHQWGTIKYTISYDKNGYFGFHQTDGQARWEFYVTPGRDVKVQTQGPEMVQDIVADGSIWLVKINGPNLKMIVPGYGPIMGSSGVMYYKVDATQDPWEFTYYKDAGLRVNLDWEGIKAFCSYLDPTWEP